MSTGQKLLAMLFGLLATGTKLGGLGYMIACALNEKRGLEQHPWTFYALLLILVISSNDLENKSYDRLKKTLASEEN